MALKTSTNGFVLAGGQSRRMGRDKALLEWGDISLLEHMIQLLSTVSNKVQVVGRPEFPDRLPGKGPLGGILTALEVTDQDANLFVAVDLPFLTARFLGLFNERFLASSKKVTACRIGNRFPLCLGIRRDLAGEVARRVRTGHVAIHQFIEQSDADVLEEDELASLGFDESLFVNINTPDDWAKFR
jgi:molybdopterin-guanine dinucleotide biosynthesis protein A